MTWTDIQVIVARNPASDHEYKEVMENLRRKAKARFYADENVPPTAIRLLLTAGASVRTAHQAGLIGRSDEDHWAYARRHGLVLVSCDRDFLNERLFPLIHSPALFVFDFGSGSEYEILLAFRCLRAVLRMPQFFDKWSKHDAKRDGWTEIARHQDGTTSRNRYRVRGGRLQQWT